MAVENRVRHFSHHRLPQLPWLPPNWETVTSGPQPKSPRWGFDGNGPKRFSVQRKMAIVARLLRGEPLELVARETNVSIARLSEWRERALAGTATALKERERDDRDDEIARLKSKVGEITMDNELLYAKIEALEGKRPLAHRRSRR